MKLECQDRDTSNSQNKWNYSLKSPLKWRNCNILLLLYKLMYTCTWTYVESIQFSVFKIISKWCNFTVCKFYITITRYYSKRVLFYSFATLINIWIIFRKMNLSNVFKHIIYFALQGHKLVLARCKYSMHHWKKKTLFIQKGLKFVNLKLFCLIINPFNDSL